jgi:adenosylcobinamide kinase/adenosylcobinamide-phosphate guanylyltransferase
MSRCFDGQGLKQKVIFVTGGAKSGKSSFALSEAAKHEGQKAFIATAGALDEEMTNRIEKHKGERGVGWDTYEEPIRIAEVIKNIEGKYGAIVVDCLTLWLSNLMHAKLDITQEIENLVEVFRNSGPSPRRVACGDRTLNSGLFLVSNEVGAGIVPENKLAREFRDLAGTMNQKIAGVSDEVFMVVAGIPVQIKG